MNSLAIFLRLWRFARQNFLITTHFVIIFYLTSLHVMFSYIFSFISRKLKMHLISLSFSVYLVLCRCKRIFSQVISLFSHYLRIRKCYKNVITLINQIIFEIYYNYLIKTHDDAR